MFRRKVRSSITCVVAIALLVMSSAVFAENQEFKVVFDVQVGSPEAGAEVLQGIHETYKDKEIRAITPNPEFVVIFMGSSSTFLSKNREGVTPENQKFLDQIAARVSDMAQDGIKLEVCDAGAKFSGIDPASVLPEIKHVPDGWISSIKHQIKGYALVPVY